MVEIIHAHLPELVGKVRSLFERYAASSRRDCGPPDWDGESADFPGEYVPPAGALLMAQERSTAIGCVGMRPLKKDVCEMQWLFVKPSERGRGIGRLLVESLIEEAKQMGYRKMRLFTRSSTGQTIDLFLSLGFREIEPYHWTPIPGGLYFELALEENRKRG